MKNPSAVEGSGAGASDRESINASHDEDQPSAIDLRSVDEGIAQLAHYEAVFGDLLNGLGKIPMPGR